MLKVLNQQKPKAQSLLHSNVFVNSAGKYLLLSSIKSYYNEELSDSKHHHFVSVFIV